MIKYIVKYQDSYVSFFLFRTRFEEMLEKGIEVAALLGSNIFAPTVDFVEWPSIHTDDTKFFRSYNESFFDLRYKYDSLFPDVPNINYNRIGNDDTLPKLTKK